MEPEFWHDRWQQGQIGFHQQTVHPRLVEHWPALGLEKGSRVLVPLCGKSLDARWLADLGHEVVGVELSPLACRAFFEEQGLVPVIRPEGPYLAWCAEGITLLQGDVFELGADERFDAVYDRAATVALPPDLRARYAAVLARAVRPGGRLLLVAFDYPQDERKGPPFAVPEDEVRRLYGDAFTLTRLVRDELDPATWPGVTRIAEETWRGDRR